MISAIKVREILGENLSRCGTVTALHAAVSDWIPGRVGIFIKKISLGPRRMLEKNLNRKFLFQTRLIDWYIAC